MGMHSILEWIMILFPILDIYLTPIPGLSIGEFLLLTFGCIYLVQSRTIHLEKKLGRFYSYALIITLIKTAPRLGIIDLSGIKSLFSYILYALLVVIYLNFGNSTIFCDKFIIVTRIICILSLLQFVLFQFGVKIPFIIPGLPNDIGRSYSQISVLLQPMCGPFCEPAHLAQFVSLGLIILFVRKEYWLRDILLFTTTIALTLKGNAVVLMVTIYGIQLFRYLNSGSIKLIVKAAFVIVISLMGIIILYNTIHEVQVLFSRIYEITGNGDKSLTGYFGVSGYFRVKYGFDFFNALKWHNKFFGIGIGCFSLYDRLGVVPTRIKHLAETYALKNWRSGITTILIDCGVMGFVLYFIALFRNKSKDQLYFAIVLIALQCVEGSMNTPMWLIYLFLAYRYNSGINTRKEVLTRENII